MRRRAPDQGRARARAEPRRKSLVPFASSRKRWPGVASVRLRRFDMSVTYSSMTSSGEAATYGGFVDALGGIAAIVLAIIGLAGVHPEVLVSIATIVFGAALLIQ